MIRDIDNRILSHKCKIRTKTTVSKSVNAYRATERLQINKAKHKSKF